MRSTSSSIAQLVDTVRVGHDADQPAAIRTQGERALYNNLKPPGIGEEARLALALKIDAAVRQVRPDDWRGHQARENVIKRALLPLLDDGTQEVDRVFLIIRQQSEY